MLFDFFILIIFLNVTFMLYFYYKKYNEGLECKDRNLTKPDMSLVNKLNELKAQIDEKDKKINVIKYALGDLRYTDNFKFTIGETKGSSGPLLEISGTVNNPVLNISFSEPVEGDPGYTGSIGKYGRPGEKGDIGNRGNSGYWGGLQ